MTAEEKEARADNVQSGMTEGEQNRRNLGAFGRSRFLFLLFLFFFFFFFSFFFYNFRRRFLFFVSLTVLL
jgi:hypothetical protein